VTAEEVSSAQKPVGAANFVGIDECSVQSNFLGQKRLITLITPLTLDHFGGPLAVNSRD
jgi:hypothetical protein